MTAPGPANVRPGDVELPPTQEIDLTEYMHALARQDWNGPRTAPLDIASAAA